MTSATTITSLGNEGFLIAAPPFKILLDPFFQPLPGLQPSEIKKEGEDVIIAITHDHWDHFNAESVTEAALHNGAYVVGPSPVIRRLKPEVPKRLLVPQTQGDAWMLGHPDGSTCRVTTFETRHGRIHNSYLIETSGFRGFHDGDNEHTDCVDRSKIQDLDLLMICPWQGSNWVQFIESLKPKHWVLMHVSEEEIAQHERGEFFPDLCSHIPAHLKVLRPGESFTIEKGA